MKGIWRSRQSWIANGEVRKSRSDTRRKRTSRRTREKHMAESICPRWKTRLFNNGVQFSSNKCQSGAMVGNGEKGKWKAVVGM